MNLLGSVPKGGQASGTRTGGVASGTRAGGVATKRVLVSTGAAQNGGLSEASAVQSCRVRVHPCNTGEEDESHLPHAQHVQL